MKKTYDTGLIVALIIIILFVIITVVYTFGTNKITNNSNNTNVSDYVYNESSKNTNKPLNNDIKNNSSNSSNQNNTSNITNITKTYEEIASYTTKIYDKDKNRIYNIKLACERLNGHKVQSNEEFSFNDTMGEMSKTDGYKKALGFDSNGKKIKVYGGGICQISSTLYNAVLIANLKVTERHAHSRRVYYVPKDKDATVFYGGPDFKFINTTDSEIIISTYTDGYNVTVSLKQEKNV